MIPIDGDYTLPLEKTGVATAAFLIATTACLDADEQACTNDAMIVFDGSGSMAEMGFNDIDEPRIFDARRAVAKAIPDVALNRRIGLLIYGPGGADGCSGIDLRFPPIPNAAPRVLEAVDTLEPAGETPLTVAVGEAAKTLKETSGAGSIVLVTDGKETCGGQPCQLATAIAGSNVIIHVIGFKVRGEYFSWEDQSDYGQAETVSRCLAETTGGLYLNTETVDELIAAFRKTLGCNTLF